MGGVFISYRRDDTAPYAGRLRDRLSAVFGEDQIFRDVDRVAPGERFPAVIERAIGTCDAFIVLIGDRWLSAEDEGHARRLENPRDYVRQEVAAALRRDDVLVIPVLVEDAEMPAPEDLPAELAPLAERNALIMSDIRWDDDMTHLVAALQKVVSPPGKKRAGSRQRERERQRARPVAPPPPPPKPEPEPAPRPTAEEAPAERDRSPMVGVIVGVVCAALVVVGALVLVSGGGDGPGTDTAVPPTQETTATNPPGPVTLTVPGGQAWTDTKIDLQVNQTVHIDATGRIRHHDDPPIYAGPEGNPDPNGRQFNLPGVEDRNHASLIGKIGEGGRAFYVGSSLTLTAPTAGRLYLGINDVGVWNNGDAFSAVITTP